MAKFTASRLSEGNKVFPAEIHCEENELTIKVPGLFGGKSQSFSYRDISSVSVDSKMVGYSTITFFAAGTKVMAHGFTKSEVKDIKEYIDEGKSKSSGSSGHHSSSGMSKAEADATSKAAKYEMITQVLGRDSESRKRQHESQAKARAAIGKFIVGLFTAGARKEALKKHNELLKITDDIDIYIAQGKKDEALSIIKKLEHASTHKLPDTDIKYIDYWADKRKEYIAKATG